MNSVPFQNNGAVESCANHSTDQGLTARCGQKDRIEPQGEFSAAPAPDPVIGVLDAVDAARPHLRFITASIRRALPTSSPNDIKGQLAGLEARLVGGV